MALFFGSDLANLEVLYFPMLEVISFDCSLNGVERVILLQVGLQRFSIRMRLELMHQLLDCFLEGAILLLDSRMELASELVVSGRP